MLTIKLHVIDPILASYHVNAIRYEPKNTCLTDKDPCKETAFQSKEELAAPLNYNCDHYKIADSVFHPSVVTITICDFPWRNVG